MAGRPPERAFFELFLKFWLPVLVYLTVIVVLSAQSHLRPPIDFRNADKFYHAGEYFGLGLLLARGSRASLRPKLAITTALVALACGIVVGTGDELFQSTVPGRDSSPFDLLADTVGVALAQLAFARFAKR